MNTKNIKKHILRAATVALPFCGMAYLSSCEDLMTVDTGDKAYVNAQDTLYSYLGIMRAMQDVAERQIILGEIRGDLVASTDYTTDTLFAISNFDDPQDKTCSMLQVSDYYNIINNCNFYIANADTSAIKANIKYMVPEYAQVKAVRAWAYLQLVKNYKEVPYITQPVTDLGVIEHFDMSNTVNKDNLVDKIIEDGILKFLDTPYPQYGSSTSTWGVFNTGSVDFSAKMFFMPIRVILGDLYLLRGNSTADYEQAATYYYDFLKKENYPLYLDYTTLRQSRNGLYSYGTTGWGSYANRYDGSNEVISLIPGTANAGFGKMLTRVADIFGYTPSSSQSSSNNTTTDENGNTSNSTDANGNETYNQTGSISVTRNYKRQYAPSCAFDDVFIHQTYVQYTNLTASNHTASYYNNKDGRRFWSQEDYSYEGEGYPLCSKAARGTAFYYSIPTYRKTLIWLRLAEAINRAGYPEFAFAILKDGINQFTLPRIADRVKYQTKLDENGDSIPVWNLDNTEIIGYEQEAVPYRELDYGTYGAMYYVTDTLRLQAFNAKFNFSDEVWNSTYGIHARGCGMRREDGTAWPSANEDVVSTSISGYRDSVYYDYSRLITSQGVDLSRASEADIINAIENVIVDELALETAFEGNRFTDLVRIAEHKNASGFDGTEWLARKIANRGTKAATEESPAVEGFDAALYSKLKNTALWYFSLPK